MGTAVCMVEDPGIWRYGFHRVTEAKADIPSLVCDFAGFLFQKLILGKALFSVNDLFSVLLSSEYIFN
jgi:hypothetical protein